MRPGVLALHLLHHLGAHAVDLRGSLVLPTILAPREEVGVVAHLDELEHDAEHHGEVHDQLLERHMQKLDAGMEARAVDDQQAADGHDEREREHLHLGVAVDEVRDGVDEDHHEEHGQHDGDDHDDEVVGHAHGRDDRVDGKDEIHDHDGAHGLRQRDTVQRLVLLAVLGFELGQLERVAQLGDTLVYKVAAADEQHEVAHRESVRVRPEVDGEQRRGHMHEERRET